MSDSMTFGRHNDFVGDEASMGRIPGAEDASTGHHFVAVDPMTGECPSTLYSRIHIDGPLLARPTTPCSA